jgi:D-3-phosphoglycerate dehydrogenase
MKIVVLEPLSVPSELLKREITALPGDPEVVTYDDRPDNTDELVERAADAEVLIIANMPLQREALERLPKVRCISVAFVGVDHIDMDYCRERNIIVSNCPGYSDEAVAELVMLLTLALYRSLTSNDHEIRHGGTGAGLRSEEIAGKNFALIGAGHIGQRTAQLAHAFGAKVIAYNRTPRHIEGITFMPIDDVMSQADIVSIHIASTPQTRHFISKERIALMKPGSILINTARGPIVDNTALAQALQEGRISGAGIDVFDSEPPLSPDEPLLAAPHTVFTPHVGFTTTQALAKRAHEVFGNVAAYLRSKPVHLV